MRYLIIILLLFVSCSLVAQQKILINPPAGNRNTITHYADGFTADSVLGIPYGCGVPTINMNNYMLAKRMSAVYFDSCNHIWYGWDIGLNSWEIIGPTPLTWQQTLDNGHILNKENDIDAAGNNFEFDNINSYGVFTIQDPTNANSQSYQSITPDATQYTFQSDSGSATIYFSSIDYSTPNLRLSVQNNRTLSSLLIHPDTLIFRGNLAWKTPVLGNGNDSLLSIDSVGNIHYISKSSLPYSNQFLTAGYGILGSNYNGSTPQTWAVDTSIITSSTVNNVFNGTDSVIWIVDSIRCDTTGAVANTNYLVCHTPTGGFSGHADLIANKIGGVWNYQIPHNGDLLSDAKPISYYQWDSVNAIWRLRSRAVLVGNSNYGGNLQIGTSTNNGIRIATKNINAISIDTSQRISLPKFGLVRSGNYLFLDSVTLNIDTGYFKPLVAGTNITINSGVSGDTINSTGGGSGPTLTHLSYHGQLNGTDTILQYRTYNVLDFGIVGDSSTDNYAKLQSLNNYVASLGGGEIFFPKGNYKVSLPPTLISNTHWKGIGPESHVFNPRTSSVTIGDTYCYFMGNFNSMTFNTTLNYALADTVRAGSNQVKATSAQTDSFSVGNIVQLFSTSGYTDLNGVFKHYYSELNKVISIDRTNGFIYLKHPFDTTMINVNIANTTKIIAGNPTTDALGNPFYIADNCSVENMSFQSSDYVAKRYGAFECNILNNTMVSAKGVGGNGLSWCNFKNNRFYFSFKAIETAIYSHDTKIENNLFSYSPGISDTTTIRPGVKIGENTRNVSFSFNDFVFGDTTRSGPAVAIDHGFNNIFRGNRFFANKVRQQAFDLSAFNDSVRTEGNIFEDNDVWADSLTAWISTSKGSFTNSSIKNNLFINNKFHGIPSNHAFIVGGSGTIITGGFVPSGDVSLDASATNYIVSVPLFGGNGMLTQTAGTIVTKGNAAITGTAIIATTATGSAGTDSVLVQNNGLVKKISPTYYGTGSGSGVSALAGYTLHGTGSGVYQDTIIYKDTTKNWIAINKTTPNAVIDIYPTFPGTVTTTSAGATIAGTSTRFLSNFKNGDSILVNGTYGIVLSIASNTSLTLTGAFGANNTGVSYINPGAARGVFAIDEAGRRFQYGQLIERSSLFLKNTAYGFNSLAANTSGTFNIGFGMNSLLDNTSGAQNAALGYRTLENNTSGSNNSAIGYAALFANTTGGNNTAIGIAALSANTTGGNNTGIGQSLESNTTGANNIAIGLDALDLLTTGGNNTGVGFRSLWKLSGTQNNNTGVGTEAGAFLGDGSTSNSAATNSIYVGYSSRALASNDANETVIGTQITGNGSNTVTIGNSSNTDNYLTGNLRLTTAGNGLVITEGTNGKVGQTTLVTGTKAITISGLTTNSRAFVQLVSQGNAALTVNYIAVCTSNTLTISAVTAAGNNTVNTSDTSILNYTIIN